jgi:hypothetical protein
MKTLLTDVMLEASSPHCKIAHLLWCTHRVAEMVGDATIADWTARELTGYSDGATLPEYRRLQARLWSRRQGSDWVPVKLPAALADRFFTVRITQSAGALADLLANSGVRIAFPLTAAEIEELRAVSGNPQLEFNRYSSRGKLEGILRHIRHSVREWSFTRLDPTGVLPEKTPSRRPTFWKQLLRFRVQRA